jgi:hypothetical protein
MINQVSKGEVPKGNSVVQGRVVFNQQDYMPEIAESIMSDEEND